MFDRRVESVLERARSMVEKGWCQRRALIPRTEEEPEKVCVSYALKSAANKFKNKCVGRHAFGAMRMEIVQGDYLTSWNDRPWRTKKDVLSAFDRAIRNLRRG